MFELDIVRCFKTILPHVAMLGLTQYIATVQCPSVRPSLCHMQVGSYRNGWTYFHAINSARQHV